MEVRMERIGVAVVGLGYAGRQHLDAYLKNPAVEVKMVCDTPAACEKIPMSGHFRCVADLKEVIESDDVALVSICTPDYLHCEQALAAINAGKHVFCEKPLATSIPECERIVDAVGRKGVKFLTGQVLRFAPFFISLKKICNSDLIGRVFFAESDYIHDLRPFLHGWRANPATAGDITVGGGCHSVDLLRWIVGDVEEVYATGNKLSATVSPFPVDNVIMTLKFADGAIGKVQITVGCRRPYALNLSIYGTKGTIINDRMFTEQIDGLEDFITLPLAKKSEFQYYDREIDALITSILNNSETPVPAIDGAKTVAVCIAGIEAMKTNRPVRVHSF